MTKLELPSEKIREIALAVGFSVHHGWGKWSEALPIADSETLENFARALLQAVEEQERKKAPA